MPESTLVLTVISLCAGLIGKALYDYFKEGRSEKTSPFVSSVSCQQIRDHCNLGGLKDTFAILRTDFATFKAETRALQKETDKRLNDNNFEIRALRKDIMDIKEAQSRTLALLEALTETIKK